jgi:3-oxoacyl-[acyl-carrier protein] reductase
MSAELGGQVALITGGTMHIGQAAAVRLAQRGATVIVNGRNEEPGKETVELIHGEGGEAFFEKADLTLPDEVTAMVDRVAGQHGRIDLLVASGAGASPDSLPFKLFHKMSPADFEAYIRAHWLTRAYAIRAVLPHMQRQNEGRIVVITTDAGRVPTVGESFIGGAAAGTVMMCRVLARELGRWGIRINCVATSVVPDAPVRWPMFEGERMGTKLRERMIFEVSRWHIADMVVHLAGKGGDAITGQTISVNGGISFPG